VSSQTSNIVPFADNTRARRLDNLANAKLLTKSGLYIFVSSGKTPLVPRFNKIDTQLTQDEREAAIEAFEAKHGEPPIHVGATNDPAVVSKMFKRYPDAVPSIACGPSKLVVVDADVKDNGPGLIGKHFDEHGLPEGTVVVPTQSGGKHYIFKDPDGKFTNAAGALKKQYGCDLRGVGGQYVAPGSVREDGKSYGTRKDLIAFLRAYTQATLPELPAHIVELIGTAGEASQSVDEADIAPLVKDLLETDWPEHAELFDPTIGVYDLEGLKARNPEFKELYDNPSADCSDNRWKLTQLVMREFPKMPVVHLAVLYEGWEGAGTLTDDGKGAGNYKLRDIGREWEKNKDRYVSDGAAMGSVVEQMEREEAEEAEALVKKKAAATADMRPLDLPGINNIPPREFIYRKWLLKGALTVLIAPGGRGKSSATLSQAIDMACGVDRLGAQLARPRAVFLYNAEDPRQEMERRAAAYMSQHAFTNEERELVKKNLFVQSGADGLLVFATQDRAHVAANDALVEKLIADIKARNIEVVILDPLATLHGVSENDNIAMTHVVDVFKRIIVATNIAMMICHHARKVQRNSGSLDANDGRGAVAVINSARIVLNINDIPDSKAAEFQIDSTDLWRYFAITSGDKTNLSARDKTVVIYKMNSVQADNGTEEQEADNTVALSLHHFEVQSSMIGEDAMFAVLAALDGDEPVGSHPRHANYLGLLIAREMEWNFDLKSVRDSVKSVIERWRHMKWIAQAVHESTGKGAASRKPVNVFVRGAVRPEPTKAEFQAVEDDE